MLDALNVFIVPACSAHGVTVTDYQIQVGTYLDAVSVLADDRFLLPANPRNASKTPLPFPVIRHVNEEAHMASITSSSLLAKAWRRAKNSCDRHTASVGHEELDIFNDGLPLTLQCCHPVSRRASRCRRRRRRRRGSAVPTKQR